jgi:N-acetylneuraminic acid mutarotase
MAFARADHTATLLANGKVLIAGGGPLQAELYDPTSNTWSAAGSVQATRINSASILLSSGKVLVAGGGRFEGFTDSAEVYDPASNSWAPAGKMSNPGSGRAVLTPGGAVLLCGLVPAAPCNLFW